MPENDPQLQRRTNLFNAWFVRLDKEKPGLLKSGRFRLLFLLFAILVLVLLNLVVVVKPASPLGASLQGYVVWMHSLEIGLLILLFWQIWRELLQPLLRLCDWAELMRGVNLDAQVELKSDSDFSELASDINMLGNMINQLSRDTEVQLQKHTDYISRESRSLVMQERTRLSHELHDSLAQTIASLRIQIRVIDETFHSNDEKSIWHQMERIEYTIDQANNQLRELIAHFRMPIYEQGLIPSIEETVRRTQEEMGIPVYFQNEWPEQEFSTEVELQVLRIVQECLVNIRKHSQAEVVRVLLSYRDGNHIVLIEDDGIGFEESSIISEDGRHLGLNILRDRAREINASIDIESEPGDGTRIHLQFKAEATDTLLESTG